MKKAPISPSPNSLYIACAAGGVKKAVMFVPVFLKEKSRSHCALAVVTSVKHVESKKNKFFVMRVKVYFRLETVKKPLILFNASKLMKAY